jgi:hypothetical protein
VLAAAKKRGFWGEEAVVVNRDEFKMESPGQASEALRFPVENLRPSCA